MKRVCTIGYEQSTAEAFFAALTEADVGLLVDVRAVAASRRPGFSKRQLAAGLDRHGIGYVHLQKLGTPKEGQLAARGGYADCVQYRRPRAGSSATRANVVMMRSPARSEPASEPATLDSPPARRR